MGAGAHFIRSCRALLLILFAACSTDDPAHYFGAYSAEDHAYSVRAGASDALRLRDFSTGETREFDPEEGVWVAREGIAPDQLTGARLEFGDGGLRLTREDGVTTFARRVPLRQSEERIASNGIDLAARLTLPAGDGPHPAVILAHGSGDAAATRTYATADLFPMYGVASVVFDKRGTGASGGEYDMDFFELADDVAAVARWAAGQPGIDAGRIGVSGYSQGGWIGPLAAAREPGIAFVMANYGMIDSPRDEARLETMATLEERGFEGEALEHAGRLNDAAVDIMASGFASGWESYDRLIDTYAGEAWLGQLEGTMLEDFQRYPHFAVRLLGPVFSNPGLPWDYTSLGSLDALAARGVQTAWLIAAEDSSAPPAFTLAELERRQQRGEPVHVQVFPGTDHGFLLFEETQEGRRYGNYHPDYFLSEVNWARRLAGLSALDRL